jgi:hypothetical protein
VENLALRPQSSGSKVKPVATKKKSKPTHSAEHGFTIVVEEMRSQFKVFGEALQGLRETMTAQIEGLRETMEARFEAVDRRFEAVDRRFEAVDGRLDRVDRELFLVKDVLREHTRQHAETRRVLEEIRDQKVDRSEIQHLLSAK